MFTWLVAAALAQDAPESKPAPTLDVRPGAFVHIRPEIRMNPSFDADVDDDAYRMSQSARVFLEARRGLVATRIDLQHVYVWGERPSSLDTSPGAYAYQGYLEVGDDDRWVRIGRQEIHILNGFFVSSAPWNVAGRSFDALRGMWRVSDGVTLDAFGVVEAPPLPETEATDDSLGGTFGAVMAHFKPNDEVEPSVWLMARGGGPTLESPDQDKLWIAPGARLLAHPGDTRVDLNLIYMAGRDRGLPLSAYHLIARIDQRLGGLGFAAIFDQSSGHGCASDPLVEGCGNEVNSNFDLGFGRNHYLRGNADQVAGVNVRDIGVEFNSKPIPKVGALVQSHLFQMTNPDGQWLRNGGRPQGTSWIRNNDDANLGVEVDAIVDWSPQEGVKIDAGYCFFQPIGAGAAMTSTDPMHYLFVRNRFTF